MKSLLCCGTAFHTRRGQAALWRWFYHYRPLLDEFGATHQAVCNDGNRNLPVETFVKIHSGLNPSLLTPSHLHVLTWPTSLGRVDLHTYPCFWRNVYTLTRVARDQGFDKLIYIDWDFWVISREMMHEIRALKSGLTTYWVPRYGFPESSVFVCCSDMYQRLEDSALDALRKPVCLKSDICEVTIPWTRVITSRVGDRYPEFGSPLPAEADYCAQLPVSWAIHEGAIKSLATETCSACGADLVFFPSGVLGCERCGNPTLEGHGYRPFGYLSGVHAPDCSCDICKAEGIVAR